MSEILRVILLLICLQFSYLYNLKKYQSTSYYASCKKFCSSANHEQVTSYNLDRRTLRCREMPLSQRWYKAKQQHISKAQKRALHDLWDFYGLDLKFGNILEVENIFFPPSNHTILDIGFGAGDSIIGMASAHPSINYIGCEIHRAGLASALQKIMLLNLTNIRLIRADVSMLLHQHLRSRCFDEVCVYFPDPWPNDERDKERRVVRPSILLALSQLLKIDGILRIATDVEAYASHVETSISETNTILKSTLSDRKWCLYSNDVRSPQDVEPEWRPLTRYCIRAKELGHNIYDLTYQLQ